jgi:hypothetical protein
MVATNQKAIERISSDAVWGASAIARFLGVSEKRVYTLTKEGKLPVGKIGGQLFSTVGRLQRFLDQRIPDAVEDTNE